MALLEDRNILVTGVMTADSLAFGVAQRCIDEGATVILSGAGRALSLTQRTARKLVGAGSEISVFEFDVREPLQGQLMGEAIATQYGHLDGVLHAIGFMPPEALQPDLLASGWEDVSVGVEISAFSLVELAKVVVPLMPNGGDIVALDFDNNSRTWGPYGHMGPAKAMLQANIRYLAAQLGPVGIRVNGVAAGPMKTMAAKSIPGFNQFEDVWNDRAPLGWDVNDSSPVADACLAFFAGLFSATTGASIPVDGGYMIVGA